MRFLIILISIFISISCLAQKQDRIWIFGNHGGIDFNDTSNVVPFYSGLNGIQVKGTVASISNNSGQLLFYTAADQLTLQGVRVFNRLDSMMLNGDDLEGHPAQTQGILILPFPNDTNRFYIFHKTQYSSKIYLYYSIVDMTLDNGLGGVLNKNTVIPGDSIKQRTTAVRNANGRDWWLIVQRWDQDEYIKYLITPLGIQGPYKQATGNPNPKDEFYSTSYFTRSGSKMVSVGFYGNITLMDFDRCTGDFSNFQQIGSGISTHPYAYLGCAFSANENVLYVANAYPDGKYVYQYDLTATNIKASVQIINTYPDTGLFQAVQYGHLLLGADNKVYVCKGNGSGLNSNTVHTQNIDVILNPDVVGPGCNYRSNYLYLNGGRTTYGLPNMVNYSLGPVVGSICDSLSTGISEHHSKQKQFTISPNPVSSWLKIYQSQDFIKGKSFEVLIYNTQGQMVMEKKMVAGDYSVPVSGLSEGLYILKIITDQGVFAERFLKLD